MTDVADDDRSGFTSAAMPRGATGIRTMNIAPVVAVAVRGDRAAVQFDEMLGDRQAETEAEGDARGRRILLAEALEDVREELGEMPRPLSLTVSAIVIAICARRGSRRGRRRRELDRVVHQVPQHLLQPPWRRRGLAGIRDRPTR